MTAVYAKIHRRLTLFLSLALILTLPACGGSMSSYVPWDFELPKTTVSKNPETLPDVSWQTVHQRRKLAKESLRVAAKREQQSFPATRPQDQPEDVERITLRPPAASAGYGREDVTRRSLDALQTKKIAAPFDGTATVAMLVPLSGKHAALGQAMLHAAQMALFDVGSANFTLVPRDTKSTPQGAASAARAALNAGADLILGPIFSEDLRAVKHVTKNTTVAVISFSTDWTLAGDNTYVMGFLPFMQVARVVQYAQDRGYQKFAVFAPEGEYSDLAINTLKRMNTRLTRVGRYSPLQHDSTVLVEDFVAMSKTEYADNESGVNFDALVLPVGGQRLKNLTALLDAQGVMSEHVKFIGTGLWDDASLTQTANLNGGWYAAPDPRLRRDFEKRYHENFGTAPPRLATLAYDATALAAVLAHTDGHPYTTEKITGRRGFAGIDGIFRFRRDGLPERGLAVLEIKQGHAKVIDPAPTAFVN